MNSLCLLKKSRQRNKVDQMWLVVLHDTSTAPLWLETRWHENASVYSPHTRARAERRTAGRALRWRRRWSSRTRRSRVLPSTSAGRTRTTGCTECTSAHKHHIILYSVQLTNTNSFKVVMKWKLLPLTRGG